MKTADGPGVIVQHSTDPRDWARTIHEALQDLPDRVEDLTGVHLYALAAAISVNAATNHSTGIKEHPHLAPFLEEGLKIYMHAAQHLVGYLKKPDLVRDGPEGSTYVAYLTSLMEETSKVERKQPGQDMAGYA